MNWLSFGATVSEAERLFKTEYFIFEHMTSRQPHIACHEYHLPAHVAKLVDFVTPTIHFDAKVKSENLRGKLRERKPVRKLRKRQMRSDNGMDEMESKRPGTAARVGADPAWNPKQGDALATSELMDSTQLENCDRQITPNCLRALYEFSPGTTAQDQNTLGYKIMSQLKHLQISNTL
jgi:tripeptidyl-peptidase-1